MIAVKIFRALNLCKVKYCLLGPTAAAFFGIPVVTHDIDIVIASGEANAGKLYKALLQLKVVARMPNKREMELFLTSKVTRFPIAETILDVLKWQEGFSLSAWSRVKIHNYHGVRIRIADVHDLILTKSDTSRRKDKADVRALQEILSSQQSRRKK